MTRHQRVNPIILSEEQKKVFVQIWNDNSTVDAIPILKEKLGLSHFAILDVANALRKEEKLRDKTHNRYSEQLALKFKSDFENGMSIDEIAKANNVGIKGVTKYLKVYFGDNLPKRLPTFEGEIWKEIEGCSTHVVSNMGRICVKSRNMIISGSLTHGYRRVYIKDDNGINHWYSIHRLVAQAFVPNPDKKPQVDHIDSDPLNNKASNLRWVMQDEQLSNNETKKKKKVADEKRLKKQKLRPLIGQMLEIESDKLELIKMIINYES